MIVKLYKNVPLDPLHQRFFRTDTARWNFLNAYLFKSYTQITHFWSNENRYIDVALAEKQAFGVNYLYISANMEYYAFVTGYAANSDGTTRLYFDVDAFQTYALQYVDGDRPIISGNLLVSNTALFGVGDANIEKRLIVTPRGARPDTLQFFPELNTTVTYATGLGGAIPSSNYSLINQYAVLIPAVKVDAPTLFMCATTFAANNITGAINAAREIAYAIRSAGGMFNSYKPLGAYVVPALYVKGFGFVAGGATETVAGYTLNAVYGFTEITGEFQHTLNADCVYQIGTYNTRSEIDYGIYAKKYKVVCSGEFSELKITLEVAGQIVDISNDFLLPISYSYSADYNARTNFAQWANLITLGFTGAMSAAGNSAKGLAGVFNTSLGEAASGFDRGRQPAICVGNSTPMLQMLRYTGHVCLWKYSAQNADEVTAAINKQGYKYPLTELAIDFDAALNSTENGTKFYKFADVTSVTGDMPENARAVLREAFLNGIYITYA